MDVVAGWPHPHPKTRNAYRYSSDHTTLVDVPNRDKVPLDQVLEVLANIVGGNTDLAEPVKELLASFERVIVTTDDEGIRSLSSLPNQIVIARRMGLAAVEVFRAT